eukprot:TRINITY_DN2909_c1_g1_i1.p1 TRINITY_DN2909_c1_g1~~TRINITY_DN2909_c1_g1_i1.p1  ORF type:complete len:336 (+),score=78.95 TRINITY_DN2909_c1_g1_i1:46-1053(+)
MFTLLCCADLQGGKVNLELMFPTSPTFGELTRRVEEVFSNEVRAMKCAESFTVNRLQIYDDVLLKWVDLLSAVQLHEYDQIYVFQPQTTWHVDTQQDLPAPRPPTVGGPATPVHHQHSPHVAAGQLPPTATGTRPDIPSTEKATAVFHDIDAASKGFFEYSEFERVLRDRGLDFSSNTIGELFYKADLNRDGRVTMDEWQNWGHIYPNTLETLYFRAHDKSEESMIRYQMQQVHDKMQANTARIAQLQRDSNQNSVEAGGLQKKIAELQEQQARAAEARKDTAPEERELIEEEIKMERQRDQMRIQQTRLHEASDKFNRNAASKGSPRRAREVGY